MHGLTAVAAQLGDCLGLLVGVGVLDEQAVIPIPVAIAGQHLGVVKCGLGQGGNRLADVIAVVGVELWAACGILPVIHHLGHCRGDATHNAVLALIDGALPVVGLFLSPIGLDQRLHAGATSGAQGRSHC